MQEKQARRGRVGVALLAGVSILAATALAIQTNEVEIGSDSVYDGEVMIGRDGDGALIFRDRQVLEPVTLLSLTGGVLSHGDLDGLLADDHSQYLDLSRHLGAHSSSFNGALGISPDVRGNSTLGGHVADPSIHPHLGSTVEVTGNWRFCGAPEIWSFLDFSHDGEPGDVELRFESNPLSAIFAWRETAGQFSMNRGLWVESPFVCGGMEGRFGAVFNTERDGGDFIVHGDTTTEALKVSAASGYVRASKTLCVGGGPGYEGRFEVQDSSEDMVFGVDAENELLVSLIENRFSRNAEFNYGRTDADFIVNGANQTRLFVVDSDQDRVIMPGFWDTDLDTGVRVEESADEDVIRFDTAGEERFRIEPDGTLLVGSAHGWDIGSAEIAHYKMNDDAPSGVVSDSLGHHGLLERDGMGEEYTTLWTQTGLVQSALDFNGTDMRIDCGNSTDFALVGDMAVSLWIRPDGWGEANTGYLIERYNVGGYRLFLQAGTNGLSFFGRTSGGASQQVASSSNAVTLGVWQHVVVTRVGTTVSFYVNGVYAGGGAIENISEDSGNANLYIANRPTWDRTFDGLIDDVRLFDRALTQSEIEGLYRFGSGTEEDSESYRLDVSGRIYASDDILTAGELVQACDPALKTAMRRPEWTADEVTSLSTRLSDAVASYRLKAHLRDEASTLSTAAPRVLGFDASKLPVECVRDVQGLLFVSPVSILALQAREIRQLREDLESLKARLEHLEGK